MKKYFFCLTLLLMSSCAPALYVPSAATTSDPAELTVLNEGRAMYVQHCGSCHSLFVPSDFSDEAWEAHLDQMQARAKISDHQKERILKYLTSYKKPEKK